MMTISTFIEYAVVKSDSYRECFINTRKCCKVGHMIVYTGMIIAFEEKQDRMKLVSGKRLARNILDVETAFQWVAGDFFLFQLFYHFPKFISMIHITFIVKLSVFYLKRGNLDTNVN